MNPEECRALLDRLRRTLETFGIRAHRVGVEPEPEQAYRLLTLLDALVLRERMRVVPSTALSAHTRGLITAGAYRIACPNEDIHVEAAAERIAESMELLARDEAAAGDGSLFHVVNSLLAAAGLLLTSVLVDDPRGQPLMDGDEPLVVPSLERLFQDAHDRVRTVMAVMDGLAP